MIIGATLTILIGAVRNGRAFLADIPGALYVLVGGALLWPVPLDPRRWVTPVVIGGAVALLVHLVVHGREPAAPRAGGATSRIYLGIALAIAAVLLFQNLGGYAGSLQRWEAAVVGGYPDAGPCKTVANVPRSHCSVPYGFAHPFEIGEGVLRHTAQRLVWTGGILSMGNTSLFYGAPTYALFHILGFSTWTLRVSAVIATLLSIVAIYLLAGRFFGSVAGAAAAMMLGLNASMLFYGRYGSSPAGTVLAVLLAVFCTWLFLEADSPTWWMAGACAAALYVATLQYAPARLTVLILLGFIGLVFALEWRRSRRRVTGIAVIVGAAAVVWWLEGLAGGQGFLSGQNEHFFYQTKFPDIVRNVCPTCLAMQPQSGFAYEVALLRGWLKITTAEYLALIQPSVQTQLLHDWDAPRLPYLYYGPLFVFIAWGIGCSLRRWRDRPYVFLLLWVVLGSVPLLLTNRVDSHRIMLFVIPVSLWAALGIGEAARVMARARVPGGVQHLLAAALAITVIANDVQLLWPSRLPDATASEVLSDEVDRLPGSVGVGALIDPPHDTYRNLEFIELTILERERHDPTRTGFFLSESRLTALKDHGGTPPASDLQALEGLVDPTLILAPAGEFRGVATAVQQDGMQVEVAGSPLFRFLRLARPPSAE